MIQNLAIASDHAGYNLKTFLINQLDSDINTRTLEHREAGGWSGNVSLR